MKDTKVKIWELIVRNEFGTPISTVVDPKFVPIIKQAIVTEEGTFDLIEVSIDYAAHQINCYSDSFYLKK